MTDSAGLSVQKIVQLHSLNAQKRPVDVFSLASNLGVMSIEKQRIASDAMLVHQDGSYKIVVNDNGDSSSSTRQRFSIAHELGHLLLQESGLEKRSSSGTKHRDSLNRNREERLCDQIAAEILMPRDVFVQDGHRHGWSLLSLSRLSKLYQTSIPATARRMMDLTPEASIFAIWKTNEHSIAPSLRQSYSRDFRFAVPNAKALSYRRMWLVSRAMKAQDMQQGVAPIVDRLRETAAPPDAPAEAVAWGRGEHRQVMVFYYPERELTDDMVAIGNATWRT